MRLSLRLWALSLVSFLASAANINVIPASTTAAVGTTVNLNVSISDVSNLYAYQFDVAFDPMILSATAVTEGSFLGSHGGATLFLPGSIDNSVGTISMTLNTILGPETGVAGAGTLASLQFTALRSGSSAISISNGVFINSTGDDIVVTPSNGTVIVGASPQVPEPATATLFFVGAGAAITLRKRLKKNG